MNKNLTLYYYDACPFCRRVTKFMQKNGISVEMRDILSNRSHREELIRIGGRSTVPCLVIDGQAMYESLDIIAYMEKNLIKA